MKIKAAVFGSTGLVGQQIVEILQSMDEVETIYSYARKPPMFLGKKMVFKPFKTDEFSISEDTDVVFCALGTTIKKAGSKEDFKEVDLLAVKRIAEKCAETNTSRLGIVSSIGADATSNNFYLRTKGKMEETVRKAELKHTVFIRPSLLLGKRNEKRLGEDIGKILLKPLSFIMIGPLKQYRPVKAIKVAQTLVKETLRSSQKVKIIENTAL
ncbi:NAD(P)H-binding protein [Marinilabilia rubra]|uniref:Semialdehyde dehydrogenase NAD-binding domain-containing protein n=1 Tax=Marinilabilia rubra TaxID=2162893 RepID=A0A2U2BC51_9BACT|nr:NAD(P)H-binding protein [Marinilabilia rubra]PWE00646.1 hypothetical protein DDZ16_03355 [Marinilabilia rubra]